MAGGNIIPTPPLPLFIGEVPIYPSQIPKSLNPPLEETESPSINFKSNPQTLKGQKQDYVSLFLKTQSDLGKVFQTLSLNVVKGQTQGSDYLTLGNQDLDLTKNGNISQFQGKPSVIFNASTKAFLVDRLKFVIVGKFTHGRPSLLAIRTFFAGLKLRGVCNISVLDKKHIFIECSCKEDFYHIWMKLIWHINGFAMRVFKWTHDFSPLKESSTVPVWIRIDGLPLYLFDEQSLLCVASVVGKPIKVDPKNISRNILSCAWVCVELDVIKPLVEDVWVCFVDEKTKETKEGFWIKVHYDFIPLYCPFCSHIGHNVAGCKRRAEGLISVSVTEKYIMEEGGKIRADLKQLASIAEESLNDKKSGFIGIAGCMMEEHGSSVSPAGAMSAAGAGSFAILEDIVLQNESYLHSSVMSNAGNVLAAGAITEPVAESTTEHVAEDTTETGGGVKGRQQMEGMLLNTILEDMPIQETGQAVENERLVCTSTKEEVKSCTAETENSLAQVLRLGSLEDGYDDQEMLLSAARETASTLLEAPAVLSLAGGETQAGLHWSAAGECPDEPRKTVQPAAGRKSDAQSVERKLNRIMESTGRVDARCHEVAAGMFEAIQDPAAGETAIGESTAGKADVGQYIACIAGTIKKGTGVVRATNATVLHGRQSEEFVAEGKSRILQSKLRDRNMQHIYLKSALQGTVLQDALQIAKKIDFGLEGRQGIVQQVGQSEKERNKRANLKEYFKASSANINSAMERKNNKSELATKVATGMATKLVFDVEADKTIAQGKMQDTPLSGKWGDQVEKDRKAFNSVRKEIETLREEERKRKISENKKKTTGNLFKYGQG